MATAVRSVHGTRGEKWCLNPVVAGWTSWSPVGPRRHPGSAQRAPSSEPGRVVLQGRPATGAEDWAFCPNAGDSRHVRTLGSQRGVSNASRRGRRQPTSPGLYGRCGRPRDRRALRRGARGADVWSLPGVLEAHHEGGERLTLSPSRGSAVTPHCMMLARRERGPLLFLRHGLLPPTGAAHMRQAQVRTGTSCPARTLPRKSLAMPECPKIPYPTPQAAGRVLGKIQRARRARGLTSPLAVHPCAVCSHQWHLTSRRATGAASRRWQAQAGLPGA